MATMTKDQLVDAISTMTIMELADLVKGIEDKFGVKAAPVGVAAAAGPDRDMAFTANAQRGQSFGAGYRFERLVAGIWEDLRSAWSPRPHSQRQ